MSVVTVDKALLESDPERFHHESALAFRHLCHLSSYYPNFDKWYRGKVIPGISIGERKIIFRYVSGELGGIAIVKLTPEERKLCCLRILPQFQGTGIGIRLFSDSFSALQTEVPLLSVSEEHAIRFSPIFSHFGFELSARYTHLYRRNRTELSYNGLLTS